MKIAIISDIHDNFHNTVIALKIVEERQLEQIIFLGDFICNGIAKILAGSKVPVFAVWGNNDCGNGELMRTALKPGSNLKMSKNVYDFVEYDSKKIFITHYPDLARSMAESGKYDAVFYGHNHLKNLDKIGKCIVCNPGEISANKTGQAHFAIYDTKKNDIEIIELKDSITTKTKEAQDYLKDFDFKSTGSKRHKY